MEIWSLTGRRRVGEDDAPMELFTQVKSEWRVEKKINKIKKVQHPPHKKKKKTRSRDFCFIPGFSLELYTLTIDLIASDRRRPNDADAENNLSFLFYSFLPLAIASWRGVHSYAFLFQNGGPSIECVCL